MAITKSIGSFFENLTDLGDYNTLLIKFLLLILLIAVFGELIKKIPIFTKKKWIQVVLTLAIPIMAVFFFPDNLLKQLLVQYKILGIILVMLPLFFMLFFIHRIDNFDSLKRKGALFFFLIIAGAYTFKSYNTNTTYTNQLVGLFVISIIVLIMLDKPLHSLLKKNYKY